MLLTQFWILSINTMPILISLPLIKLTLQEFRNSTCWIWIQNSQKTRNKVIFCLTNHNIILNPLLYPCATFYVPFFPANIFPPILQLKPAPPINAAILEHTGRLFWSGSLDPLLNRCFLYKYVLFINILC